jgi:hypothetical protein
MITGNFKAVYFRRAPDKLIRKAKPIMIIGDPDNQRPDKWSSTVLTHRVTLFYPV